MVTQSNPPAPSFAVLRIARMQLQVNEIWHRVAFNNDRINSRLLLFHHFDPKKKTLNLRVKAEAYYAPMLGEAGIPPILPTRKEELFHIKVMTLFRLYNLPDDAQPANWPPELSGRLIEHAVCYTRALLLDAISPTLFHGYILPAFDNEVLANELGWSVYSSSPEIPAAV